MKTKTHGNLTLMSQILQLSTYGNINDLNDPKDPNEQFQSHSTLTRSLKIRYHIAKQYHVLTPLIGKLLSKLHCHLYFVRTHGQSPNFPPTENVLVASGYSNENSTLTVMSNDIKLD